MNVLLGVGGLSDRLVFPRSILSMKRSVGPTYWQRPATAHDEPKKPKGFRPLAEGPVISSRAPVADGIDNKAGNPEDRQVKPYGRGSLELAVQAASSGPRECMEHIAKRARAANSHGPTLSRERTWESVAKAAGYDRAFDLVPDLIYSVMGALDKAGYRSAELYLEVAKQRHIEKGQPWTAQLALAAKCAKRACQRGRGPAKQAQPLPLADVSTLTDVSNPLAPGGPEWAVRSTVLASWWLLREIEASNTLLAHVQVDPREKLIKWNLPSSKADWRALGATRTHTCSCAEQGSPALCPYHLMVEQVKWAKAKRHSFLFCTETGAQTTKSGWAGTFEAIAQKLKLKLVGPTGLRLFTGHSARATGAVHMARTQIELWRIQLFGRWGSEIFKQYVRDAPLEQLHGLAQEVSLKASLASARAELSAILAATKEATAAATGLAHQPVEALADCEAAAIIEPPAPDPPENDVLFVRNRSSRGKVHLAARHGNTLPHYLWRTKCFWHFARGQADYALLKEEPNGAKCSKCFKLPASNESDGSSSSSSRSQSSES